MFEKIFSAFSLTFHAEKYFPVLAFLFQSGDTVTLINSVGFPIVVALICFGSFRYIWLFLVEQMRCKDETIKSLMTINTEATKAQTQMLTKLAENLENIQNVHLKQIQLLEEISNLFHNKNKH
jgi:hypothetical protein